jgi:predicted metalloprotease
MAYVIAHEVGHHIQKLTGVMDKMNELRQQLSKEEYNQYSVRLNCKQIFTPVSGRTILNKQNLLKVAILMKH